MDSTRDRTGGWRASTDARLVLCGAVLVLGGLSQAIAQEVVPALVPRARVRVTAPSLRSRPVVGKLVAVRTDTILLVEDGATAPTALLSHDVTTLDVSRGMKRQTRPGAVVGMLVGGIAGVVIGSTEADRCRRGSTFLADLCDLNVAGGFLLGMTAGGLLGGVVGSRFRVEQWQAIPLVPPGLHGMVAPGRAGLALAVAF